MRESESGGRRQGFAALRHPEFSWFWSAALLANIGAWMQLITVPYVIHEHTHSTGMIGLGAFLALFPTAALAPLGGSLADRFSRRNVMLWTQAAVATATLFIWVLWASGALTVARLLVLIAIGASARGMALGTLQAFVAQLVPPESLLSAVRLNQATNVLSRALGPTVAGLLLAWLGPGAPFLIHAASSVVACLVLLTIRARPASRAEEERAGFAHYWTAIQYVRVRPILRLAVLLSLIFMGIGTAPMNLIEPFARSVLQVGPAAYGMLYGCYGAGSVLATPFVLVLGPTVRRSHLLAGGLTAFGVAAIALGASPAYGVAAACALVMGAANTPVQMSLQTAMQYYTDEQHRGRVMSMYVVASFGGSPATSLVGGLAAEFVGLRATFIANGVLFALLALTTSILCGGLAQVDRPVAAGEGEAAVVRLRRSAGVCSSPAAKDANTAAETEPL